MASDRESGTDHLAALHLVKSRKISQVGQLFCVFYATKMPRLIVFNVSVVLGGYT